MGFRSGDIVSRRSYQCDVIFKITEIRKRSSGDHLAILYGESVRLVADAFLSDLVNVDEGELRHRIDEEKEKLERSLYLLKQDQLLIKEKQEYVATNFYRYDENVFHIPGKVLHLDGDPAYLDKCLHLYEKIGVPVHGEYCKETEMPKRISELMEKYQPDILVITGHDAYSKHKGGIDDLNAYRHSKDFVKTVKLARKWIQHRDQLIIFAGACQSHFESLIRAGANFASSPSRVNIHALDPVYIVAKISFTPFVERINVWDILKNTLTREKGLGGIETKGVLRMGMPFKLNNE
ncbi:sporulation peptidase YabG [Bacillus carboniphilus]|uniref:Sporulation peptidase YabG n=1 Tax=Bacillus carboniphilus TaxID=86663 RepID=A0ABY9JR93_9BACI|nr:sporulation peptidase YabG [Bacillus carboniphilus]WLR41919.1 sporulation peptidase YabG [Bacillus carboniphilus]